ncbi:MAG: hypothetical protein ACE5JI_15155 [Acidobacteriota bacterium]
MESRELLLLLAVAVPAVFLLRYLLPKIPLIPCQCQSSGGLWDPKVEDYGLRLTEDSAEKRLRTGRVHERLESRRGRRGGSRRPAGGIPRRTH